MACESFFEFRDLGADDLFRRHADQLRRIRTDVEKSTRRIYLDDQVGRVFCQLAIALFVLAKSFFLQDQRSYIVTEQSRHARSVFAFGTGRRTVVPDPAVVLGGGTEALPVDAGTRQAFLDERLDIGAVFQVDSRDHLPQVATRQVNITWARVRKFSALVDNDKRLGQCFEQRKDLGFVVGQGSDYRGARWFNSRKKRRAYAFRRRGR